MINENKLGHQAPKDYRGKYFQMINLDGDFAYCESHNFVYHPDIEEEKLYNAEPCFYTDIRYKESFGNFYHSAYLYNRRRSSSITLKSAIRRTLKTRNIPVGTIVDFKKDWYYRGKKFDNSFKFKVKNENNFDPKYEINSPKYTNNFSTCEFSKKLTDLLRENGFLVEVEQNSNFLTNMVNNASAYMGNTDFADSKIEGEVAVAYGHGKKIGFSSYDNDLYGYTNGYENVLWDKFDEFCKWSRCNEINKSTPIEEILNILLTKNEDIEDEAY